MIYWTQEVCRDQRRPTSLRPTPRAGRRPGPVQSLAPVGRCQRRGCFLIGRSERQREVGRGWVGRGRAGGPCRSSQSTGWSPLLRQKMGSVANATIRDILLVYMEIFPLSSPLFHRPRWWVKRLGRQRNRNASEIEKIWRRSIDFCKSEDLLPRLRTVSH